jgi:hypothetical protein
MRLRTFAKNFTMGQNLYALPEPKPTPEMIQPYLENPDLRPPDRLKTPLFYAAVEKARAEARWTSDALARNPEYTKMQAQFAGHFENAMKAVDRKLKYAELRLAFADATLKEAKLKTEGNNDAAHAAHMEGYAHRRQADAIELEDLQTKNTDADPYKPLDTLKELMDKMAQTAKEAKPTGTIYPRGLEHRAKWTGPPRKQL